MKDESLDWDKTNNIYIEGDNLEVLKLLQKSYWGKIKMIYIDPPYNTGNDFVYKDDYKDPIEHYLEVTGQIDDEGNKLSTNTESEGRFHSNWLNMMYPRLILARTLLKEDGVIFISIDDHEVENLKKMCSEVFGEKNFIGNIVVETAHGVFGNRSSGLNTTLVKTKEYILAYCKSNEGRNFKTLYMPTKERFDPHFSTQIDQYGDCTNFLENIKKDIHLSKYFERYKLTKSLQNISILMEIDKEFNQIILNDYSENIYQSVAFDLKINCDIVNNELRNGKMVSYKKNLVYRTKDGKGSLRHLTPFKQTLKTTDEYKPEYRRSVAKGDLWKGFDNDMKNVRKEGNVPFDTPKPIRLIKNLIKLCGVKDEEIIMDFFAGVSSSTHAVLDYNLKSNKKRRFIQVQLPEPTDPKSEAYKAGFNNIAEIGKERIRRVIKKIKEENPEKSKDMDLGFKVFKLDSSNFIPWDENPDKFDETLFREESDIKAERSVDDVIYELLLKQGIELTEPIEKKVIDEQTIYNISKGNLFICLGDQITETIPEEIGKWKEQIKPDFCKVIFKDRGFISDKVKTNTVYTLERYNIKRPFFI
ncbi:MAG: site-specific DNA-methyltransferase [Flavobacteriaceae bacterium]|nr:site-specific DNA-methyltransferase [Flavobacteriaceae bacterium]